jgi:RimJ/RimL family protein N-acetyltransferase
MEQTFSKGEYKFTLIDKDSLNDLAEVTETIDARARQTMFKWVLAKQNWFALYIVRRDDEIIARVEIRTVNHSIPFYEIGIEVKSTCRNLGHGESIINHTIDYLRDSFNAKRLQSVVNVDNKASNAMFRKTKMSLECKLQSYSVTVNHDPCDANIYSVIF